MRSIRGRLLAAAVTVAALTVAAPVSSASAYTWPVGLPSITTAGGQAGTFGCAANVPSGFGSAGGVENQVCGGTLAFIGPSVGQVATVIGPTIIGSTVLAPITVSAGSVQH